MVSSIFHTQTQNTILTKGQHDESLFLLIETGRPQQAVILWFLSLHVKIKHFYDDKSHTKVKIGNILLIYCLLQSYV